jgi:hypothetical protein
MVNIEGRSKSLLRVVTTRKIYLHRRETTNICQSDQGGINPCLEALPESKGFGGSPTV